MEAAKRLIEGGFVKPSYGRKGHLKAIWLGKQDGGNSRRDPRARRHALQLRREPWSTGRCWKLRRLDMRDEDGIRFSTRRVFLQVVADCMAS